MTQNNDSRFSFLQSRHFIALWETVCCFLIAVASFLVLSTEFDRTLPMTMVFVYPAVILSVLYFAGRNKWTFLAFGFLALAVLAFLLFGGTGFTDGINGCIVLLDNIIFDAEIPPHFDTVTAYRYLCVITYICICTVVFILVIPFRKNWGISAFSVAMFVLGCFLYRNKTVLLTTVFLLVGNFVLLAEKKFFKKRRGHGNSARILSVFAGAGVMALIFGLVITLLTRNTDNMHIRICTDAMADIQSVIGMYPEDLTDTNRISLKDINLQSDPKQIGGHIERYNGQMPIARIDDTKSRFFRLTTFDRFNGSSWYHSDTDYYRIDGNFDAEMRDSLSLTENVQTDPVFKKYFEASKVTVTNLMETNYSLGLSGMENFVEETYSNNTLMFNTRGEIVSPWTQNSEFSYSYTTHQFKNYATLFDKKSLAELDGMAKRHRQPLPSGFLKQYTQVPKKWSALLSKQLKNIKTQGVFTTVYNCVQYFNNIGIRCTDNPAGADKNYSPIDSMVLTKSGNCVQYATGLCMILRSKGIPCRLSAGYISIPSDCKNVYYLSTGSVYCAVEVYLPGIGWLQADAFPTSAPDTVIIPSESPDKPEDNPEEKKSDDDGSAGKESKTVIISGRKFVNAAETLAAVLFALAVLRIAASYVLRSRAFVNLFFRDNKSRYLYYYRDMMGICKYLGIKADDRFTMRQKVQALLQKLPLDMWEYYNIAERVKFDNYLPTDSETEKMRMFSKQADGILKSRTGKVKFVVKRKWLRSVYLIRLNNKQ